MTDLPMEKVVSRFHLPGSFAGAREINNGNINRTYEVSMDTGASYIFQKINTYVFRHPREVMENILHVTEHIKKKLEGAGDRHDRRVLSFLTTLDGVPYLDDDELGFWRAYRYIDQARTYNVITDPYYFLEAGKAFGEFQGWLADFPAQALHETIPAFHNTAVRMEALRRAIEEDKAGRAESVREECAFLLEREPEAGSIVRLLENGVIPYRVTHNDTKINNILFDVSSDKAICVIDLDTVMPGSSLYDYGDAIRSGASSAEEDEEDLDKVWLDLKLYEAFTRGFLENTAGLLTEEETANLPLGAKIMTLELAARFLTDYLNGDVYFKTTKAHHNLIRARTQIRLTQDMERKWSEMQKIAADCRP